MTYGRQAGFHQHADRLVQMLLGEATQFVVADHLTVNAVDVVSVGIGSDLGGHDDHRAVGVVGDVAAH